MEVEKAMDERDGEISLPGYMLLIDEPEIALHPNGIRAASKYLYELANDPSWQVMLTTHSPLFINPFEDHTTIVRLSRNKGNPNPSTYRSDEITFTEDEIDNLKLLNSFDQNLSEMFFGQYPIIVEGDTEYAAFDKVMRMENEKYHINYKPILIRARGKFTMVPLIKMLAHFKVNFSVLHDSDYPKNKKVTSIMFGLVIKISTRKFKLQENKGYVLYIELQFQHLKLLMTKLNWMNKAIIFLVHQKINLG
ncbi:AAA family ATPase [Myroides ceti]|uniref:AAA family ATPase n=1 Tax=Paenimyroides ceti TaxID=395087 RepID=A0ABT8CXP5_9FLAO|nr:AAA family ATPase [Paenimyroides ceti]